MAGYDRYSSIIADVLCQPALSTPITVGLFAKWGSGKSFILERLQSLLIELYSNIQVFEPFFYLQYFGIMFAICI